MTRSIRALWLRRGGKRHATEEAAAAPVATPEVLPEAPLSYHDLHITTPDMPRTSMAALPYGIEVRCNRVTGWTVWNTATHDGEPMRVAGEYALDWLVLDVAGAIILDTRPRGAASPSADPDNESL